MVPLFCLLLFLFHITAPVRIFKAKDEGKEPWWGEKAVPVGFSSVLTGILCFPSYHIYDFLVLLTALRSLGLGFADLC